MSSHEFQTWAYAIMIFLDNQAVADLIGPELAVDAIRRGYGEYRDGLAAQVPRVDLVSAAGGEQAIHRFGIMAGVSREHGVAVVRIKSDVVSWSDREEKHAGTPGTYGGSILAYSTVDGRPLALIQDGVLQHWRVGAAAAVGTDWMARPGPVKLGLVGSGGMARVIVECLRVVRPLVGVRLFSPNAQRRASAAESFAASLGAPVEAVGSVAEACVGADVIVTATSSLEPTLSLAEVPPGAHVTAVSRREVGADLRSGADVLAVLGQATIRPDGLDGGLVTRGGYTAVRAMTEDEMQRVPKPRTTDEPAEHWLVTHGSPDDPATRPPEHRSVLVAVGTQGIQFAATVGAVLAAASGRGIGEAFDESRFLQQVRS
jgi:alanine dehydrogenase